MSSRRFPLRLVWTLALFAVAGAARAQQLAAPAVTTTSPLTGTGIANPAAPYNGLILQQIHAMPSNGGYSAGHLATLRLAAATSLDPAGLNVAANEAMPSYCSGATYLVFLKTVGALARSGDVVLDQRALRALLVNGQRDGEGVWGRWNANGPGTARLFYEMGLGRNFTSSARPGPAIS